MLMALIPLFIIVAIAGSLNPEIIKQSNRMLSSLSSGNSALIFNTITTQRSKENLSFILANIG